MNDAVVREYREQIEELTETIRQLRDNRISAMMKIPRQWKLTRSQSAMLGVMMESAQGMATNDALRDAVEAVGAGHWGREVDVKNVISVQICKMRKLLKPHGVVIETVWAQGYRLSSEGRAIIRKAVNDEVMA